MNFAYIYMDTWYATVTGMYLIFKNFIFFNFIGNFWMVYSDFEYIIVILLGTLSNSMYTFSRYQSNVEIN